MNRMTRTICLLRCSAHIAGAFGALAVLMPVSGAVAQDVPVTFNAGFGNQGTAWIPTASYLQQRLLIETLTPNTGWNRPFAEQSVAYRDALASWGRTNVIGLSHSNGGIVTRNYVHANGVSGRLNRLATIGTPHQGASIAANVINGRVGAYFGNLAGAIGGAVTFYANNDPAWNAGPVVDWLTQDAMGALHYAATFLANTSAFSGLGIAVGMPVTGDVSPGSAFMGQYNSAAHLSTESSTLQTRVGISTQVHPNGGLFRLISSNPRGWRTAQAITASGALALYFYYAGHPDWWLSAHAAYWLQVYWYTTLLDVAWQDFIGALQAWNGVYAVVSPSDGFIPHWSSQYPGAHYQFNMNLPGFNTSHTEQKDHPDARNRFLAVFTQIFSVPVRPAAPPSPPGGTPCTPTGSEIICPT